MNESIEKIMGDLRKVYGESAIGTAKNLIKGRGSYSTGSIQLDAKLGGGYPKGRMIQLAGPFSSGKSSSAIHAMADCQSKGGTVLFMDLEGTLSPSYASNLGVDMDQVIYIPPMQGENALEMAEKLCKSGDIDLFIIDSVPALLPGNLMESGYGNANIASLAKLCGEMVKRFTPIVSQHNICMLMLNQERERPGVAFGPSTYLPGGTAIGFYSSLIIKVWKSGAVEKDKDGKILSEPRKIKITKCKINDSMNEEMMVDITYGEGFDKYGEVLLVGTDMELIEKKGSWYSYKGSKIGQGRTQAKQFLKDNPEVFKEIKDEVWERSFIPLSADIGV